MSGRKDFLKNNWRWLSSLVSLLVDFLLLNISFIAAILIRAGSLEIYKDYTKPLVFFNVVFLVISMGLGLYRSRYNLPLKKLRFGYRRLVLLLAVSTMAFLYIIKKGQFYSRAIVLITFLLFYLLLELTHSRLKKLQDWLIRKQVIGLKTIVVGTDRWSFKFFREISNMFGGFYQIIGHVRENGKRETRIYKKLASAVIGDMEHFANIVEKYQPDLVFIASNTMKLRKYRLVYEICKRSNIRLKMVSAQVNSVLHNSRIRDISGVTLVMENWRVHLQRLNYYAKRVFDLVFVLMITPIILPVGLITALLVKITSKGPVFFKQARSLYEGGARFDFYKFRSMYQDAEELKEDLYQQNEANGALFKMKKDPRVTPVGRFIRKLSLDELPQFINVLKGEMSIVGPRPLPVKDFALIHEEGMAVNGDWYKQRGNVKAGITGLWQVSGRSNISFEDMIYLDLYYVEHQSIFFDLEILFETIPAVLFGRGAY